MNNLRNTLERLARETTASVLPMMAIGFLVVLLAIGGGIDFARAHLAQARLQEAVDSAALAGRRTMSQNKIETARPQVNAFMDFNFPEGYYGTEDLEIETTKPDVGVVRVEATARLKTSILALAGMEYFELRAVSEATQNLDNVDIILVLDTTGSMDSNLNGRKKIDSLKEAVRELYSELKPAQDQLRSQGLRLRIGVVPYSSTVNVGKILYGMNTNYIQTQNVPYYHWRRNNNNQWSFGQRQYNLSSYVGGGTFGSPNGHTNRQNERWAGCVEERDTIDTITANDSRNAPPPGAHDLDVDLIPTSDNSTKWKPYIYDPLNGSTNLNCPSEVTPLAELSSSDIDTIVNKLDPQGSTFHDIGMIWATRMISNGGVFGSQNPSTYNGRPVNKHIIYMTDGQMSAPVNSCQTNWWGQCTNSTSNFSAAYSGYGIEAFDRRVGATTTSDNNGRHTKRFLMMCNAAKAKNITIWTVAFGTGNVDSLDRCASNSDLAFTINDSEELIEQFAEIGRNIGALRLSK